MQSTTRKLKKDKNMEEKSESMTKRVKFGNDLLNICIQAETDAISAVEVIGMMEVVKVRIISEIAEQAKKEKAV